MNAINRLKDVLVGKQRIGKWLAVQLGKSQNAISRRWLNKVLPALGDFVDIPKVLVGEV